MGLMWRGRHPHPPQGQHVYEVLVGQAMATGPDERGLSESGAFASAPHAALLGAAELC